MTALDPKKINEFKKFEEIKTSGDTVLSVDYVANDLSVHKTDEAAQKRNDEIAEAQLVPQSVIEKRVTLSKRR